MNNESKTLIITAPAKMSHNFSIAINDIPRERTSERAFRVFLQDMEEVYGKIDWNKDTLRFRYIEPIESRIERAHCFVHFKDPSIHEIVVRENPTCRYRVHTIRFSLSPIKHPVEDHAAAAREKEENKKMLQSINATVQQMAREMNAAAAKEKEENKRMLESINSTVQSITRKMNAMQEDITATREKLFEFEESVMGSGIFSTKASRAKCPVCLEKFDRMEMDRIRVQSCGHFLCSTCMTQIQVNNALSPLQCPVCKTRVTATKLYFV